jgi:hypothetical protein
MLRYVKSAPGIRRGERSSPVGFSPSSERSPEVMSVRRNTVRNTTGLLLCLVALLLTPGSASAAPEQPQLDLALCAPDQNSFTLTIDNAYFPLPVGREWVYTGKEQGEQIGLRITVLKATETFHFNGQNVRTRVVQEVEWADANADGVIDPDEELIEVSLNYFAQTDAGTVCYFGENVDIYEDGEIVSHEGAWRADGRRGLPGIAPGIFMPESPEPGMTFQQEVAPGVAEDQATVTGTGTATLPDGTVVNTITVRDFNPLDGSRGTKVYAEDFGLIQDGPLDLISVTG